MAALQLNSAMKSIQMKIWLIIILYLVIQNPLSAEDESTIAVVSSHATVDGRPLLWENRNSDHKDINVQFFKGVRYDYTGVINANDTLQVWMGLNTAGFGIVYSNAFLHSGERVDPSALFVKYVLGLCSSLEEFETLLKSYANKIRRPVNFGCFDVYSDCAMYETRSGRYLKIDAADPLNAPRGYLVRANFSFTDNSQKGYGAWRYHRAVELFEKGAESQKLDYRYILRHVARDIASAELAPYPLPFRESFHEAPRGFIKTEKSINSYKTVATTVIHGVKNEDAACATMWVIPGEPICGQALPIWPHSGESPKEAMGQRKSKLNGKIQLIEDRLYPKKKWSGYLDSQALMRGKRPFLQKLFDFEDEIFKQTNARLKQWRQITPDLAEIKEFQGKIASKVTRSLRF